MKIKSKSLASLAAAVLLVIALTAGTLSVFAMNGQEDSAGADYAPTCTNYDVYEPVADGVNYLYDVKTTYLGEAFPDKDFRIVENSDGGWTAYNTEDIIAPCGTVITSEEFAEANRLHHASGGEYWPEVFRLLFEYESCLICQHRSVREQVQQTSSNTTAVFCWVRDEFFFLWCAPCAEIVGFGSSSIDGPTHTFQTSFQEQSACTRCSWVQ